MWYFTKLLENKDNPNFNSKDIFADCWASWRYSESYDTKRDCRDPNSDQSNAAYKRIFDQARDSEKSECTDATHIVADDPYRWQAHLLRWPDLIGTNYNPMTSDPEPMPTKEAVSLSLRTLAELTLGWTGIVDSGVTQAYQAGIERTWGLNPRPRVQPPRTKKPDDNYSAWSFTNLNEDPELEFGPRMARNSATFAKLRDLYNSPVPPPLWVLSATMANKGNLPNVRTLYEISPFIHGTPDPSMGGFVTGPLPNPLEDIPTAVRASAGFADAQGLPPGFWQKLLELTGRILPAARWGVNVQLETGAKVRLSDGGGTDNLGLLSLLRRRLDHIIVVDSGQDELGRMEDICWARKALDHEGHDLGFDALKDFELVCKQLFDKTPSRDRLGYNPSMWFNPVVKGHITSRTTGRTTHLWLLKPAWNQKALRDAFIQTTGISCGRPPEHIPCGLLLQYANNTNTNHSSQGYMPFPQTGTVTNTFNSSSYRTLAFRELGRMHASHLVYSKGDGGLSITPLHKPMEQRAFKARPNSLRSGPGICSSHGDPYCGQTQPLR